MEVSSIITLLASFQMVLTKETIQNLSVLFRGALLADGPRTVTGCLCAAFPWVVKHWTVYENVLRRARFSSLALSRILFQMIMELCPRNLPLLFIIDETLVRRYGPRVVGIGMHRDAVRSSKHNVVVTPGHKWICLSIAVKLPFANRYYALPILTLLYTTKKPAKRNKAPRPYNQHRTVGDLTLLAMKIVIRWMPRGRKFLLIGDGAYGSHEMADAFNPNSSCERLANGCLVSRFRLDGATYGKPTKKKKGRGRKPVKGKRLATPKAIAEKNGAKFTRTKVKWYGATVREVLLISRTGLWYKCGYKPTMIRWVLVRDPEGKREDEVFFTTDLGLSQKQIIELYVRRWSLETTFQEAREYLGIETLRNRCSRSIGRTVPMLFSMYSLVVLWFTKMVKKPEQAVVSRPWYEKHVLTFSDMFRAAQQNVLREPISPRSSCATGEFIFRTLMGLPAKSRIGRKKRAA